MVLQGGASAANPPRRYLGCPPATKHAARPGTRRSAFVTAFDVHSIGLNPTPTPVDLDAAWVDHKALDAARFKEPRQPERIIAYFIAERDHRRCAAHLGPAVSGCSELRHQLFCAAASDWINARLLPIRKLDRQQPALLAQFQRAVKSVPRNRRARCPVHW